LWIDDKKTLLVLRHEDLIRLAAPASDAPQAADVVSIDGVKYLPNDTWEVQQIVRTGNIDLPGKGVHRSVDESSTYFYTTSVTATKLNEPIEDTEFKIAQARGTDIIDEETGVRRLVGTDRIEGISRQALECCIQRASGSNSRPHSDLHGQDDDFVPVSCGTIAAYAFLRLIGTSVELDGLSASMKEDENRTLSMADILSAIRQYMPSICAYQLKVDDAWSLHRPIIAHIIKRHDRRPHFLVVEGIESGFKLIDPPGISYMSRNRFRELYGDDIAVISTPDSEVARTTMSTSFRVLISTLAAVIAAVIVVKVRRVRAIQHAASGLTASALLFIAAFSSCTKPAPVTSGPLQCLGSSEVDAGVLPFGSSISQSYEVRNITPAPVKLSRVVGSCGCAKVSANPTTVEPGAIGEISVEAKLDAKWGKKLYIHVYCDDRPDPVLLLSYHATIDRSALLTVEPSTLCLNETTEYSGTAIVSFFYSKRDTETPLPTARHSDWLSIDITDLGDVPSDSIYFRHDYRVNVRARNQCIENDASVQILAQDEGVAPTNLRVRVKRVDYSCSKQSILFRSTDRHQQVESITLTRASESKARITAVSCNNSMFAANKLGDDAKCTVSVTYNPSNTELKGPVAAELEIVIAGGISERIRLPILGLQQ
jgi:hypothetical protein